MTNDVEQRLHYRFVSGQINGPVYTYMQKVAAAVDSDDAKLTFNKHISNLINLKAETTDDCQHYFTICESAPKAINNLINVSGNNIDDLCKFAFINKNRYDFTKPHNFTRLALDFICENNHLLKQSHPNNYGIEGDIPQAPYNLDKWTETMRQIYDIAYTNNASLDSITKQITTKWDENERINFGRWMRYYQEGNYGKYNVKTAQYFINRDKAEAPVKSNVVFDAASFPKIDPIDEKKRRLEEARHKLRGRLKAVEELVEKYRDVLPKDLSAIIRKDIYDLKERVIGLELRASVVDSIIRTSNQLTKRGFVEGAAELKKIAQEVAENKLPEVAVPAIQEPAPAPIPEEKSSDIIKVPDSGFNDNITIPDFSSATHRDALVKLEEINKVVSERNVIRALAAVDIILGQLGIAAYFPALSEAQSKLLDAFTYAGTRIATTIGQMRGGSGKAIIAPEKYKNEDVVDVAEDLNKPVGEVINSLPEKEPKPAIPSKPIVDIG